MLLDTINTANVPPELENRRATGAIQWLQSDKITIYIVQIAIVLGYTKKDLSKQANKLPLCY
jgi:hypothetical protein